MNGSTKEGMETRYCPGALEGIKYEHPVSGVETPLVQSPDTVCCTGWNAWSSLTSKKIDTEDRPNARQFLTLLFVYSQIPAWSFSMVTARSWVVPRLSVLWNHHNALPWIVPPELQVTISPPSLELAWHGAQLESKLNDVSWFMVCLCFIATALSLSANKSTKPHLDCFGFSLRSTF